MLEENPWRFSNAPFNDDNHVFIKKKTNIAIMIHNNLASR